MPSLSSSPVGADRPRVEVRPPGIVGTLGGLAIALSSKAGLVPEPWQADALRLMMSVRADGLWACDEYAEWIGRQEGKTGGILTPRALTGFLVLGERLVMWSAHYYATALESFILARDLMRNLGEPAGPNLIDIDGVLIKVNNTNGEEGFEIIRVVLDGREIDAADTDERLRPGARWRYLARSKASGRGFTGDTNVIDEAWAFTDAQKAALYPTMTARPNPQAVLASTPPLDKWSGDVMFALRKKVQTGDVEGLGLRDWGDPRDLDELMKLDPQERKAILDDPALWLRTCPAIGRGRVSMDSIRRLRRQLSDEDFAREVTGMWPMPADEVGGKIPYGLWTSRFDPERLWIGRPVLSIEASNDRASGSISLAARRPDGAAYVELQDDRPGQGLDWIPERAAELDRKAEPLAWAIDPTSPAGALLPALRKRGIEPVEVTGRPYVQACGELYDAVMAGALYQGGQSQLDTAVKAARGRDVGDGAWAWARRDSPVDISRVIGVTLAHHLLLVLAPAEYDVLESAY